MKQGSKQNKFDDCVYFKKQITGSKQCKIVVTIHVDDCEVCGMAKSLRFFQEALEREFGKVKVQDGKFKHCSVTYEEDPKKSTLTHSQCEFVMT